MILILTYFLTQLVVSGINARMDTPIWLICVEHQWRNPSVLNAVQRLVEEIIIYQIQILEQLSKESKDTNIMI
ncbi:hypothetical protein D3C80_1998300 [compost metagenome]